MTWDRNPLNYPMPIDKADPELAAACLKAAREAADRDPTSDKATIPKHLWEGAIRLLASRIVQRGAFLLDDGTLALPIATFH